MNGTSADRIEVSAQSQDGSSARLMIVLGILWLLLAAAIVASQFSQATPIKIEWRTETEVDTAGFNVYRSTSPDGQYVKINEQLIPGQGSATSGASYEFVDEQVEVGQTYYYRLEDVELDNSTERHEVIEHTVPFTPWWVPPGAAISILAGLFLLVKGLREVKER